MTNIIIADNKFVSRNISVSYGTKVTIVNPKRFLTILGLITMVLAVILSVFVAKIIVSIEGNYVTMEEHQRVINEKDAKIATIQEDYKVANETIEQRDGMIEYLKSQQVKLIKQYDDKIETINVKSVAFARKYWYIFKNYQKNSTLTFADLENLEEESKKRNINPHLVANLWSLESGWNANADNNRSTALGLGQFLRSTGKFVYGTLLGRSGEYKHETMAIDPKLNTEMTLEYLSYLLKNNKGDIKKSLINYNGNECGPKYYEIIDGKMKAAGLGGINNTKYYNNRFNTVM